MVSNSTFPNLEESLLEESFDTRHELTKKSVVESDENATALGAQVTELFREINKCDEKDLWKKDFLPPVRVMISDKGTEVLDLAYRVITHVAGAHLGNGQSQELLKQLLIGIGINAEFCKKVISEADKNVRLVLTCEPIVEEKVDGKIVHSVRRGEGLAGRWMIYRV